MHQPPQRLQMVNESLLSLSEKGVGELMGPLNEKESKKGQKKFYADSHRLRSLWPLNKSWGKIVRYKREILSVPVNRQND